MKKRVYNIKGKRLVEGDINSITKEEMHVAINEAGKVELSAINDNGEVEKVAGGSTVKGADGMWKWNRWADEKVFVDLSTLPDNSLIEVHAVEGLILAEDLEDISEKAKCNFVIPFDDRSEVGVSLLWASPTSSGGGTEGPIPIQVITPVAAHNIMVTIKGVPPGGQGTSFEGWLQRSLQHHFDL